MTLLSSDRALLDGFRRGDRDALARVYQEYSRPLFGLLRNGFTFSSQGRSIAFQGMSEPWLLEDMVQEVFYRAFQERARLAYDGLRPYRNYLFTIGRNLVIDEYRRRTRHFVPLDELTEAERSDVSEGEGSAEHARQLLEDEQTLELVRAFVAGLDEEETRVFEARFRQGKSVEECAQVLGITEYRVKRAARGIRKRFFAHMQRHGYFEGYRHDGAALARTLTALLILGSAP